MKRFTSLLFVLTLFAAMPLMAESVEGILMDNMCMGKFEAKGFDAAKMHTRDCALMGPCKASGFAIIQADGKVVKLDDNGNKLAIAALEDSDKEKDLQVSADGKVTNGVLATKTIALL